MKIEEFCRNLIQMSRLCDTLYNVLCATPFYKRIVSSKIKSRLDWLKTHHEIKFMLETTSICNARCVFCPYENMKRKHINMTDEIFETILKRIKDEQIKPASFDLFMIGEPFLDKKLFERIKVLQESFPHTPINITSNFAMVTPEIINNLLEADIDFINISLNASDKNKYKQIMKLDYDKTVQNILQLTEQKEKLHKKLRISISMVIYDDTTFKDILRFVFKWYRKVDTLRLQRASNWGGNGSVRLKKLIGKTFMKKLYPCNDLFERLPILSNGDYALCCQDAEGLVKLNVLNAPILEAWNSQTFKTMREIHLGGKLDSCTTCKNCFATNSNGANWLFPHK